MWAASSTMRRRSPTRTTSIRPRQRAAANPSRTVSYGWKAAHVFHRAEARNWNAGPGRACGAFSRASRPGWRRRCGERRPSPGCRRTRASQSIRGRPPREVCACLRYDHYLAAGYPIAHRRHRRSVPAPGPRPDGVDRRPLAPSRRRGGPEAPSAASQRRLQRVLGLSRTVRVPGEPRAKIHRWNGAARHRANPTACLTTPSTGQVVAAPLRRNRSADRRKRAAPNGPASFNTKRQTIAAVNPTVADTSPTRPANEPDIKSIRLRAHASAVGAQFRKRATSTALRHSGAMAAKYSACWAVEPMGSSCRASSPATVSERTIDGIDHYSPRGASSRRARTAPSCLWQRREQRRGRSAERSIRCWWPVRCVPPPGAARQPA